MNTVAYNRVYNAPFREIQRNGGVQIDPQRLEDSDLILSVQNLTGGSVHFALRQNPPPSSSSSSTFPVHTLFFPQGEPMLLPEQKQFAVSMRGAFSLTQQNPSFSAAYFSLDIDAQRRVTVMDANNPRIQLQYALQPQDYLFRDFAVPSSGQPYPGGDAFYTGSLRNGSFAFFSQRELGVSKYRFYNEDNGGFSLSPQRLVVTDGLGGNPYGQYASFFAARSLLSEGMNLQNAFLHAHNTVLNLGAQFTGYVPDTTFAAAEFDGDKVHLINAGDVQWALFRGGSLVAASPVYNRHHTWVTSGRITWREIFISGNGLANYGSVVENSLLYHPSSSHMPHDTVLDLERGDLLYLFSDGLEGVWRSTPRLFSLPASPKTIACLIRREALECNNAGTYLFDPQDGGDFLEVSAPQDNTTLAVYRHGV